MLLQTTASRVGRNGLRTLEQLNRITTMQALYHLHTRMALIFYRSLLGRLLRNFLNVHVTLSFDEIIQSGMAWNDMMGPCSEESHESQT